VIDDRPSLETGAESRAAAIGCLRISVWLRRIGMDSAWRFVPAEGQAFGLARATLTGGGLSVEVAFPVEDLAVAADDDGAVGELAQQAIATWRVQKV